jgi:Amt family ammonium transporter
VLAGHGVGGVTGALLTGVFAEARWGGTNGLLFGHPAQLGVQAVGVLATVAYSAMATFAVLKLLGLVIPLRATTRAEGVGMDITQHGEEAYAEGEGAVLVFRDVPAPQHAPQALAAKAGAA